MAAKVAVYRVLTVALAEGCMSDKVAASLQLQPQFEMVARLANEAGRPPLCMQAMERERGCKDMVVAVVRREGLRDKCRLVIYIYFFQVNRLFHYLEGTSSNQPVEYCIPIRQDVELRIT